MSGFMYAAGTCIACGQLFTFNPHSVPSTSAITGEREPICSKCFALINAERVAKGLPEFALMPGAYEPAPEDYS